MARYLFHNVYGDADALTSALPKDVTAVPFGWDTAAEETRNAAIATAGISISALPSLVYTKTNGAKAESRIADQSKPWSWYGVNNTLAANYSVTILGDSIIANMASAKAGLAAPFASSTTYLGVSGDTLPMIKARMGSIPSGATHVFIEGGTNDFLNALDSGIISNYTQMIEAIASTKKIILIGIPQVDEDQLLISHSNYLPYLNNAKIAAMNAQLVTLCESYSNCSAATDLMNLSMVGKTSDGVHPTSGTYTDFVNNLMPVL